MKDRSEDPSHHELTLLPRTTSRYRCLNGTYTIIKFSIPNWFRREEPAKVGPCARDRRSLQQLALNVHVKLSDLT